jgi:hypothetical protein
MSYGALLLIVIITILVIVIAILFTIGIDDIARLSDGINSNNERILDNVTSIGGFVVIFLIFIIALCLTIAILEYYSIQRGIPSNWAFYGSIILVIALIGLIILEIHLYNELSLYQTDVVNKIIDDTKNEFFWGIALTVLVLLLSIFLIAIV